jgi:hypothetical protein
MTDDFVEFPSDADPGDIHNNHIWNSRNWVCMDKLPKDPEHGQEYGGFMWNEQTKKWDYDAFQFVFADHVMKQALKEKFFLNLLQKK